MALKPDPEPLGRALDVARRDDPAWPEVRAAVLRRIRATTAPGEPVALLAADGTTTQDPSGSRSSVSTRVLRAALRRALTVSPTHAPAAIDLVAADERLARVGVEVVAAYGTPLPALAARLHDDVRAVLDELLGEGAVPAELISVTVVDVVAGDPTLT